MRRPAARDIDTDATWPSSSGICPLLKLITGDAIYATRPLAELLLDNDCNHLLQIKGNQKGCSRNASCRSDG